MPSLARIVAEYMDEKSHVPKNTSVIIKRLPKAMLLRMRYEQKQLAAAAAFPCNTETANAVRHCPVAWPLLLRTCTCN